MVAPNTNTSTFENISVRKGYPKGQNAMGMKWSPKTKVTLERSQGPYGQTTVKFIADDGSDFKMESNTICCWRDNTCVEGTRKELQHKVARLAVRLKLRKKFKQYRIDLMDKFGDVVVSFSAPNEETYRRMSNVLTGIIGPSKCEVEDTRAEKQRKGHLISLTARRSRFPGGRRRTRKHKKRKTKRRRKTKRNKRKRKRKTKRRKRGGEKAELNACIKKCNEAEEERKKQKRMERKAREKELMKRTYAMGYQGAIAAHEKRQRDRLNPITGRAAAMAALKKEATRPDRLFGGGKRRR